MSMTSVHLVVQRYRHCKLLIEEKDWVSLPSQNGEATGSISDSSSQHCGLLVYVSFAQTDKTTNLSQVAEAIINLPVLTTGLWGDGCSTTTSIRDLAAIGQYRTSIALVPQANLISKVRSTGKQIQYHGQIEKKVGESLFHDLVDCVRGAILELQCARLDRSLPDWYQRRKQLLFNAQTSQQWTESQQSQADLAIPPELLFNDVTKYGAWDDSGIPQTDQTGVALAKNAIKKLRKMQEAHRKRHEKWKAAGDGQPEPQPAVAATVELDSEIDVKQDCPASDYSIEPLWSSTIEDSFCQIVAGSFGRRQGLELQSDMGPFCHVLQL